MSLNLRMSVISLSLVAAFALLGASPTTAAPATLSLAEAVATSIGVNAKLKDAQKGYETSLSQLRIASFKSSFGLGNYASLAHTPSDSGLSDRLFGNLDYKNLLGTTVSLQLTPFGSGNEQGSIEFLLRHPLMKGRGILSEKANAVLAAQSESTVQNKDLYTIRQATVLDVARSYYRAVLAREQVKVQERAVQIAEEVAVIMRRRADEGLVAEFEASQAEVGVAQARNQLNVQQQAAKGAVERLMLAIGEGVGQNPELVDKVPEVDTNTPGLADAIRTALANRAELVISDVQLSEQARRLAIAQDQLRPGLNMITSFNSWNDDTGIISRSLFDAGSFTFGVEYSYPLDRRIDREKSRIAQRDMDVMKRLRSYRMESIAEEVRSAHRGVLV